MRLSTTVVLVGLVLSMTSCAAPYDPDKWLFDKVVFEIAPTTDSEPNARALERRRFTLSKKATTPHRSKR